MSLWYEKGNIEVLQKLPPHKIVCVDVETTGIHPEVDEVLQIAILRGDGVNLFSSYFKPESHKSWYAAQRVHGISPYMVRDCPSIHSYAKDIEYSLANAALIIGYNLPFDLSFLKASEIAVGESKPLYFDVMRESAPVVGRWDADYKKFLWAPLSSCAQHYGYIFQAHNALEDARATLHCFWSMLNSNSNIQTKRCRQTYLDVVAHHASLR